MKNATMNLCNLCNQSDYKSKSNHFSWTLTVTRLYRSPLTRVTRKLHTDLRKLRQGNTARRRALHPVITFRETAVASQHSTWGRLSTVKWNCDPLFSKSSSAREIESSASHVPTVDTAWETVCLTQPSESPSLCISESILFCTFPLSREEV